MKLIEQQSILENYTPDLERNIEMAGRTCYKSEDRVSTGSAEGFIQKLIRAGHESVIEHGSITVCFICDRAVSHELVRHRLASYSQESQRYVGYRGEVEFVRPWWMHRQLLGIHTEESVDLVDSWKEQVALRSMLISSMTYQALLNEGVSPQQARVVLPNSVKTEIVVTANPREWRHIFKLRTGPGAYPQIRELMAPLRDKFAENWPGIFKDLKEG